MFWVSTNRRRGSLTDASTTELARGGITLRAESKSPGSGHCPQSPRERKCKEPALSSQTCPLRFLKQAVLFWNGANGGWPKPLQLKLLQAQCTQGGKKKTELTFICSSSPLLIFDLPEMSEQWFMLAFFKMSFKLQILQEHVQKYFRKKTAWG